MGAYYDEIEIEDMAWDDEKKVYHYPCPCGDRFEISRRQLADYEDIATCPSCSLVIRIIYDPVRPIYLLLFDNLAHVSFKLDFEDEPEDDEESEEEDSESDDESDDGDFEDALEKLTISDEAPKTIAVTA